MAYSYDEQNIFAKILRGQIPNSTVLETDHSLAFHDINPAAPNHILVIPKGPYVNFDDFASNASDAEIIDFTRAVAMVCDTQAVSESAGGRGYRLISNAGEVGLQEVPHYHMHILGGRVLGPMLAVLGS